MKKARVYKRHAVAFLVVPAFGLSGMAIFLAMEWFSETNTAPLEIKKLITDEIRFAMPAGKSAHAAKKYINDNLPKS